MSVIGVAEVEAAASSGTARAPGGTLRIRPGDVVTPLARDRAAALGVSIEVDATAQPSPPKVGPAPPISVTRRPSNGERQPDPPSAALYRRGAPVVDDRVAVEANLGTPKERRPVDGAGRVTVVGAGHVGATTAMRLAEADVFSEVVLTDVVPGLAAGLALDLWHSSGLRRFATRLRGGTEISEGAGSQFVVVTAGRARQPGMSRTDLTQANAAIVGQVCEDIRRHSPDAIVVVVTNPLDEMTHLAWRTTGFPPERVMGMAGVLDAVRFSALAALATDARPDTISALALGSHGEEMVIPLSQARIGGEPIERRLDRATLDALVERTRGSGAEVVKLLEKGSAYYAPAAAVTEMVLAMARDTKAVLPACVLADGTYGIRDVHLGLPARLGRGGVEGIVEVELTPAEREELGVAATRIAERVGELAGV